MKKYKIAVVGATGMVGRTFLKVLEEVKLPAESYTLFSSARSAGTHLTFMGKDYVVKELTETSFDEGFDIALFSAGGSTSEKFAPIAAKKGCVVIDNSSAWRMDDNVPLVVPEVNPDDIKWNKGIIANPNCSTIITLMAVAGLAKLSPIKAMVASTYQAVSGAGQAGFSELQGQMEAIVAGKPTEHSTFPTQICLNVIPHIGDELEKGYTDEEMKMQNEGRRIFHRPELKVTCTCVRVPVMRSHSISVTVKTERRIELDEARAAIAAHPGVRLIDDYQGRNYPTPLDTSDQDLVWVGRVRRDLVDEDAITLWCCGDQIRKGAAANAVQILRLLAEGKK